MGRALTAVGIALTLCIGGLGLVVYLTRVEDRIAVDSLLAEDLTRAIATAEQNTGGRVNLTKVARFDWEEVLLVAPRTTRAAISAELGYEWKGDLNFGFSDILIFLQNGQVVRFADYRGEGVFDGFDRPFDRIPRQRPVLHVRNLTITP
ncbi:MAG TPA: hypothetical protein VF533_19425 [Solirubrobacteraceae bacterium]|jgi:hypothetical protein